MEDLRKMGKYDPEGAVEARKFIFSKDTFVEEALAQQIDEDEIEYYPGSIKGPEPEDDPEAYAKWFATHQPKSLYPNGMLDMQELGVKPMYIRDKVVEQDENKKMKVVI